MASESDNLVAVLEERLHAHYSNERPLIQEIVTLLKNSTIVPRQVADKLTRFWLRYLSEAEEYDEDFLNKYNSSMDSAMIFAGLFSAVNATFATLMQPDLLPDPSLETRELLRAVIYLLNETAGPPPSMLMTSEWSGPSTTVIWVQSLLYASLACSLFTALGAVMGKQWLSHYRTIGERGTIEARCRNRQKKLTALETWHFRAVLEVLPVLLQMSLLLFGAALSAYMWNLQRTIATVLITANALGALFYFFIISASFVYPDCPYYSPLLSYTIGSLQHSMQYYSIGKYACSAVFSAAVHVLQHTYRWLLYNILLFSLFFLLSVKTIKLHCVRLVAIFGNRSPAAHVWTNPMGSQPLRREAPLEYALGVVHETLDRSAFSYSVVFRSMTHSLTALIGNLLPSLPKVSPREDRVAAMSVLWVLETSTDPVIRADALYTVPEIQWPLRVIQDHLPLSLLDFTLSKLVDCFRCNDEGHIQLVDSDKAVALSATFLFIYWERRSIDGQETFDWFTHYGSNFVDNHRKFVDALGKVSHSADSTAYADQELLYLVYLTLGPHSVSRFNPSAIPGYHSESPPNNETLCARTVLRLAYTSILDPWTTTNRLLLLSAIERCCTQTRLDETRQIYFLAFAIMLGYPLDADLASNILTLELFQKERIGMQTAEYVLVQVKAHLSHLWDPSTSAPIIRSPIVPHYDDHELWLDVLSKALRIFQTGVLTLGFLRLPHLSDQYLDVCASLTPLAFEDTNTDLWPNRLRFILDFLRLSVLTAAADLNEPTPSHTAHLVVDQKKKWAQSTHGGWLATLLEVLHGHSSSDGKVTQQAAWHATADIFLILSCMSDLGSHDLGSQLSTAIDWAIQTSTGAGLPSTSWNSPEEPVFRLQSATLCLIHAIIQSIPGNFRKHPLSDTMESFPTKFCSLVSLPNDNALPLTKDMKGPLYERDKTFTDILVKFSHSNITSWVNDTENDPYIRQWLQLVSRWRVSHEDDDVRLWKSARLRLHNLSIRPLLSSHKIYSTNPPPPSSHEYWHSDSVQRNAFIVAYLGWWWKWEVRRNKAGTLPDDDREEEFLRFEPLVQRTLGLLQGLRTDSAKAMKWWIEAMHWEVKMIVEHFPPAEEKQLRQLLLQLGNKMDEIRHGYNGYKPERLS